MRFLRTMFVVLAPCLAGMVAPVRAELHRDTHQTPVALESLDPAAFADLVDGVEAPIPPTRTKDGPRDVIWTRTTQPQWSGVEYGLSRNSGLRHLRFGFREAVPVGSVLVRGGGRLSVLKPSAPYPGDLDDDSQWILATRLEGNQPTNREVDREGLAQWILPPGTTTRALRFTHEAQPADRTASGWLGGLWVNADRRANIAPQAVVSASSSPEAAAKIVDGTNNETWRTWNNGEKGGPQVIDTDHAEWVVLTWSKPVTLGGLTFLGTGFSEAEIQACKENADSAFATNRRPWETVAHPVAMEVLYPLQFGPNFVTFDKPVTTRCLRVRMIAPPICGHPHLEQTVRERRKVWLAELVAWSPLGEASLETTVLPKREFPPPPIAVKFTLPEPAVVTLVIEDPTGKRIRNLVSETPFPAGENTAWWDGSDDLGRDIDAARHGLYHIPTQFVEPGNYQVRGLSHRPLKLTYDMSVYSPGQPVWETADGTGCWMTNHTPPTCVAAVPGSKTVDGQPLIFMGAYVAEGGHGLQWTREDGTKLGGQGWIGGSWTGAPTLAVDTGKDAIPTDLCYVASVWEGELRISAKTQEFKDRAVLKLKLGDDPDPQSLKSENRPQVLTDFDGGNRTYVLAGIAAHDGLVVLSLARQNELLVVNAHTSEVTKRLTVRNPRGLTFTSAGDLLVLTGTRLMRFPAGAEQSNPSPKVVPTVVIGEGLEDPRHVVQAEDGTIVISDQGASHQVKVFNAKGKFLRAIGKPGAPTVGPYDPLHMNHPNGLTIDSQNRIWVAEDDYLPKRVSLWSLNGDLLKAWYGPTEYGGGGTLDSRDKTKFFYKGLEFQLDWQAGTNILKRVYYRPEPFLEGHYGPYSPETPLYPPSRPGERYLTSCYTHNPTNGDGAVFLWHDGAESAKLVAALGTAYDWHALQEPDFRERWPAGIDPQGDRHRNPVFFQWADSNSDGRPQPAEVAMRPVGSGGITILDDLSAVCSNFDGKAVRFKVAGFNACGAPLYDSQMPDVLVNGAQGPASSGGGQALTTPEGWTILTNAPKPYSNYGLGGVLNGEPRWSYPSLWPGLHASHEAAVPDHPGEIVGHTRLLGGWVKPAGEGGSIFAINGNMGNIYLMTADGLFVGTLFHDIRQRPNWAMPRAIRGMDVSDVSLHDENFWPSITQLPDGEVYLVEGARTSLVKVHGLETIRRIPPTPLTVTTADLAKARDWLETAEALRQAENAREPLTVEISPTAPVVDGRLDDWPGTTQWATIDRRGVKANFNSNSTPYDASAAMRISGNHLYLAWRTTEPNLLENAGTTADALFKTGGCLDLMLATDTTADPQRAKPVVGDLRLLMTKVKGGAKGVLYRPTVPNASNAVGFSSPWRTISIDVVKHVDSEIELATDGKGNYEARVPLDLLDWKPVAGHSYQGDLGVLRGNGFQTLQRVYWSNKATSITSDLPSEAELTPRLWGRLDVR